MSDKITISEISPNDVVATAFADSGNDYTTGQAEETLTELEKRESGGSSDLDPKKVKAGLIAAAYKVLQRANSD